ncbi:MAG: DUF4384 domain-containing protein [Rikenellaceae bacterium]
MKIYTIMKFKSLFIILVSLLFSSELLHAQEIHKVRNVVGRWEVSSEITPKQAEERAIMEAKKEALRRAGVVENVWSLFGQVAQDNNTNFFESTNQLSAVSINGMVRITKQKITREYDKKREVMFVVATISCDVIEDDTKVDPEFAIEVSKINAVIKNNEPLSFKVKIHNRTAHLKIFWFDDDKGDLLFPNSIEVNDLLQADTEYSFPINKTIDYLVYKDSNSGGVVHKNNLLFVATVSSIPYTGEMNFKSVIEWAYRIPVSERVTEHKFFLVE